MTQQIENIKSVRKYLLNLIADLTPEQLNKTPEGFSNNIIWNLAHLMATQQRICYLRAGLKPVVQEQYITPFIPGTKPEGFIDAAEIETLKSLFISVIDELETDYKKSFFPTFEEFTTRYGVTLTNIDDAINFLPYHEGYHTGVIIELMKFV
ncbi:MAG: DinB family protein [Sphingobacteriaceae bacterium]|nr:MAG: DinB family protein [Sphingobacteriaceae bacterium]